MSNLPERDDMNLKSKQKEVDVLFDKAYSKETKWRMKLYKILNSFIPFYWYFCGMFKKPEDRNIFERFAIFVAFKANQPRK